MKTLPLATYAFFAVFQTGYVSHGFFSANPDEFSVSYGQIASYSHGDGYSLSGPLLDSWTHTQSSRYRSPALYFNDPLPGD